MKLYSKFGNNPQVEGTRCSPKVDWHCVYYLVRGFDQNFTEDTKNPSNSNEIRSGAGNGEINELELLANAITEGFTATYDGDLEKWTLVGTSGDSVTASLSGSKWTLNLGTKVKVVIEQKATPFETGDKFVFSVFKSSAPGGKQITTGLGQIDPFVGP